MRYLPRWWKRHFLQVEFAIAALITLLIIAWAEYFQGNLILEDALLGRRLEIYTTLAAIYGALLGFTITTESIVLGYATSDRLAIVREGKQHEQLWRVFMSAIRVLGFGTIIALLGLLVDSDSHPGWWFSYLTMFVTLLAAFRLMRCIWVLENIINIITSTPETEE